MKNKPKFCIEKDFLEITNGRFKGQTGSFSNYDEQDNTYLMFLYTPKKTKKGMKNIKVINSIEEKEPFWIKEEFLKKIPNF